MQNMMKTYLSIRNYIERSIAWTAVILAIFAVMFQPEEGKAGMKSPPPETIKAIIVGDRVVDIAYNLGILPEAMSVRGSLWPMASKLKTASQILGCPRCIVERTPTIVPDTARKRDIKRIIIEKHPNFCMYMPKVRPDNVVPLLKGMGLTIEYVDFSQGLESAIRQTATLLGRKSKADALIERYNKALARAKSGLPKAALGKKVIILSGTCQPSTGKRFLRVEAPGGYSDRFFLEPLGCVNVGDCFKPANGKAVKGHYMVRKRKGWMILEPLIKADPDVIIMTGDALAVQKTIQVYAETNPAILDIKAVKDMAVYSLPFYADSSVLEYPAILTKWAAALSE
jgi:hypothetical protein